MEMIEVTNPGSNELILNGNNNEISEVNQYIYNANHHFTDIMKDVFTELREIIVSDENEYISEEDSLKLEDIIMDLEEDFYDGDTTKLVISFVKQMKANSPQLTDTLRLNSLLVFLTIISFCGGEYSFKKNDQFLKFKLTWQIKSMTFPYITLNFQIKNY